MKLNRITFYLITFLFLLLPLSVNYRLLLFGEHTKGQVVRHINRFQVELPISNPDARYSVIGFNANGEYVEFVAAQDLKYKKGRKITIFFNENNPKKFLMFNFAGLLLTNKMIIPLVFFIIWLAFYASIQKPSKRILKEKKMRAYVDMINKNARK